MKLYIQKNYVLTALVVLTVNSSLNKNNLNLKKLCINSISCVNS